VCGSVRFWPEQICAVTDSVSEQQRSVRSISRYGHTIISHKHASGISCGRIPGSSCHRQVESIFLMHIIKRSRQVFGNYVFL